MRLFFSHWIPAEYIFQAGFRVPKSRLWDSPPGGGGAGGGSICNRGQVDLSSSTWR